MSRLFWIVLGAVVGIFTVRKISQTVDQYTPAGMSRSLASVGEGLREMAEVVREGMAEREAELRGALGVDAGTLSSEDAQSLLQDPSGRHAER